MKTPTILVAENLLNEAEKLNPCAWIGHSKTAVFCAKAIAEYCDSIDTDIPGSLHIQPV